MSGGDLRHFRSIIERPITSGCERIVYLGSEVADVDGNVDESKGGTVSAFNGEPTEIHLFDNAQQEGQAVGDWLKALEDKGIDAGEMGVFVRSAMELDRARATVRGIGIFIPDSG